MTHKTIIGVDLGKHMFQVCIVNHKGKLKTNTTVTRGKLFALIARQPPALAPEARAVSFTLVCPPAKRPRAAQTYLDQLCQMDAGIARAHGLTQGFLAMVRERRGADLEAWMAEAISSGIAELARFARGLQEDLAAVTAGLTLGWSNGPVEGQVTRLKLLKRQGYGRAGVPLLRQRVMPAA